MQKGQSLQAAIDAAPPGSVLVVHSGTYSKIRLKSDISVVAAAGETPVITGASGSWQYGVEARGVHDVVVRGFTIRGNFIGVFITNSSSTLIEDNSIFDNAEGMELRNSVSGVVIRGNAINANNRILDANRAGGAIGLYYSTGSVIEGNSILDNTDVGIEVYGAWGTTIRNNHVAGSYDAIETGVDAGGTCGNITIAGNVFERRAGGLAIQHGIWWRCGANSTISGNRFVGLDGFMVGVSSTAEVFSGPMNGLRITDNVFSGGRAYYFSAGRPTDLFVDGNEAAACTGATCPIMGTQVAQVGTSAWVDHCRFSEATGYDRRSACS